MFLPWLEEVSLGPLTHLLPGSWNSGTDGGSAVKLSEDEELGAGDTVGVLLWAECRERQSDRLHILSILNVSVCSALQALLGSRAILTHLCDRIYTDIEMYFLLRLIDAETGESVKLLHMWNLTWTRRILIYTKTQFRFSAEDRLEELSSTRIVAGASKRTAF